MNGVIKLVLTLILAMATVSVAAEPAVQLELIDCYKIADDAPHSAFTDLTWKGVFFCAFRQGRGHVSTDGRIRVIYSPDAENWRNGATLKLDGYDLRDAHLSITPDDRIMLIGGAAPRTKDGQSAPTGTFVAFSKDGTEWTQPEIVIEPGRWMWRVTWHNGTAWGVSYPAPDNSPHLTLLRSDDGLTYSPHVRQLFSEGRPNETTLRFDSDGTCYALIRRAGPGEELSSTILGQSAAPYNAWTFRDLRGFPAFGGPDFVKIAGDTWLAAGRVHQNGAHTAICRLDVRKAEMTALLKLPSGGDNSYPGLLYHHGLLYVSYYSSHEGKAAIYLAKIKVAIPPEKPGQAAFGAEPNPTGSPIGGGPGYKHVVTGGDYHVKTAAELIHALELAQPDQIVYVEPDTEIDLTGHTNIPIDKAVTLAGNRGRDGSAGPLLYADNLDASPIFAVKGPDVRITGLRIKGPDQTRRTSQMQQLHREGKYYTIPNSDAIIATHPGLEVDNCELYGFSHAAVFLKKGAADAHIHHNHIHHNQRQGLGYGVCLDQSNALIEANLFDYCRHHIAGTGRPGTSYEARYNVIGEHANGHSFDMHGGADRRDGTDVAGDTILIHHNTFKAPSVRSVVIRGKPRNVCDVHHNIFPHIKPTDAVAQTNAAGNLKLHENLYGPNRNQAISAPEAGK